MIFFADQCKTNSSRKYNKNTYIKRNKNLIDVNSSTSFHLSSYGIYQIIFDYIKKDNKIINIIFFTMMI